MLEQQKSPGTSTLFSMWLLIKHILTIGYIIIEAEKLFLQAENSSSKLVNYISHQTNWYFKNYSSFDAAFTDKIKDDEDVICHALSNSWTRLCWKISFKKIVYHL